MTAAKYWDGAAWQTITAIQGPKGDKGDKGDTGATGATGGVAAQPRVTLRYANATPLPLANAAIVPIPWDTEVEDVDNWHSPTVNPSRLTCPAGLGGTYLATVRLWYASNATNGRYTQLYKNGGAVWDDIRTGAAGGLATVVTLSAPIQLVPGDYVEAMAYQNSGAASTVVVGTPYIQITRISL